LNSSSSMSSLGLKQMSRHESTSITIDRKQTTWAANFNGLLVRSKKFI
jgi:hypothetical protein